MNTLVSGASRSMPESSVIVRLPEAVYENQAASSLLVPVVASVLLSYLDIIKNVLKLNLYLY
ncbi:hypothetical protein [Patiriisocius sp. Uisw_047]|uniref:hypothetical protein n=1 Tax=Patiriisocius sp. Uisw_047 TaxID=3230969 RepID=UPI0039E7BBC0